MTKLKFESSITLNKNKFWLIFFFFFFGKTYRLAISISTTTDAIEWAILECIYNANVMSKAQVEFDKVVGTSRRVEDGDIPNLKYLQAIIKENFCLHPVAPLMFPHLNGNDCKVFGYDIPRGTPVFVNIGAIARDPSIWKDSMVFKPKRFLHGMPHANTNVEGKSFELLPFRLGE